MFIKYRHFLLIALSLAAHSSAQVNEWPYELYVPYEREPMDSLNLIIKTRQTLFEKTFKSNDSLSYIKEDSGRAVEQNAFFNMKRDAGLGTMNSYSNLSGKVTWDKRLFKKADIGMDWRPVLITNSGSGGGAMEASLEIGPVSRFDIKNIPVKSRTGFAARGWNDNMEQGLFQSGSGFVSEIHEDMGAYGALDIGDYSRQILDLPLYFQGSVYGRISEDISRQFSTIGSALYADELPGRDSVFVYCTDSVSSGQEGFLSEQKYVNIPKRTANSLRLTGAFKGRPRMHIKPAIIYSLSQYSVTYFDNPNLYNDKNNISNNFNFLLHSDSSFIIDYKGGIGFEWEKENKLQKNDDLSKIMLMDSITAAARANLRDYDGFRAMTRHELSKKWKSGFGMKYVFDISRYTKKYPNLILSNGDSVRVNEDYNWIVEKHRAVVNPFVREKIKSELSGDIIKNTSQYLKKEFSIGNGEDRTYIVGLSLQYLPLENFSISEKGLAKVERTIYSFPEKHSDQNGDGRPDDPARYSRRFTSDFKVDWKVNDLLSFTGKWKQVYWDDGYWHGKEYFPTEDSADIEEYYARDWKSIEYSLFFMTMINFNSVSQLSLGWTFEDMNYQVNDGRDNFREDTKGLGRVLEPFFRLKAAWNQSVLLDLSLKYKVHDLLNEDPEKETEDYWDIDMFFHLYF